MRFDGFTRKLSAVPFRTASAEDAVILLYLDAIWRISSWVTTAPLSCFTEVDAAFIRLLHRWADTGISAACLIGYRWNGESSFQRVYTGDGPETGSSFSENQTRKGPLAFRSSRWNCCITAGILPDSASD